MQLGSFSTGPTLGVTYDLILPVRSEMFEYLRETSFKKTCLGVMDAGAHGGVCRVEHSVHSGKDLCSDYRTLTYHQSDDVVAVRCGTLKVLLQGASGAHCMAWHYRRSGNRLFFFSSFFSHHFCFPAQLVGGFPLSDLLDKPWSQVSSLLPPVRAFIFIAHRVHHSHCSSIFIECC